MPNLYVCAFYFVCILIMFTLYEVIISKNSFKF